MKNGRCYLHGGASPGAKPGNSNARTHGAYSRAILPSERALYNRIQVGSLDEEIKIIKLQLVKALEAQRKVENFDIKNLEIKDIEGLLDGQKWESLITLITRLSGRIGSLEAARANLLTRLTIKRRFLAKGRHLSQVSKCRK